MEEFKKYKKKAISEMRAYKVGEDLSNVSLSQEDSPGEGGMIARNPKNHDDQWYVAEQYFLDNYEQV
jgi:hypothetical protein